MHWQAAEAWNKAGEEEKAPHVAAAAREKEQYERLCDEYTEKKDAATASAAMNRAKDLLSCLGSDRRLQVHFVGTCNTAPVPAMLPWHRVANPYRRSVSSFWSSLRLLVVSCSKLIYRLCIGCCDLQPPFVLLKLWAMSSVCA